MTGVGYHMSHTCQDHIVYAVGGGCVYGACGNKQLCTWQT